MTAVDYCALIDVLAKVSLKTGVTLTGKISGEISTERIIRANVLVGTLVNVNATRRNGFISIPTATCEAAYCVSTVYITPTETTEFLTLIDVFAFMPIQKPLKTSFTTAFFVSVHRILINLCKNCRSRKA